MSFLRKTAPATVVAPAFLGARFDRRRLALRRVGGREAEHLRGDDVDLGEQMMMQFREREIERKLISISGLEREEAGDWRWIGATFFATREGDRMNRYGPAKTGG